MVSAVFQNLFSKKIVGTIQSGLPSIIQIEIRLLEGGDRQILRKQLSRTILYDIWDERYVIESHDTIQAAQAYTDFEKVKAMTSRMENVILVPKDILNRNATYQIRMRVGIIPISSRQGDKVTDWLLNPNQTEENLASEDRSSGFKLNLSSLISLFVGGDKSSKYVSSWHSAESFNINDLK